MRFCCPQSHERIENLLHNVFVFFHLAPLIRMVSGLVFGMEQEPN